MSAWRELGVHTEIKLPANGEIAVIESAVRLAGWSIIPQVESVFGVNLVTTHAMSLLNPKAASVPSFGEIWRNRKGGRRHHQSSGGQQDRRALGFADPTQRSRRLIRR
jgi:hypothetical protein